MDHRDAYQCKAVALVVSTGKHGCSLDSLRMSVRRNFAAWFEPNHHTVEPTADFFARRFGDMEDLGGRPFIGPTGQMFDTIAARAGLKREAAYLTNAVKHFKFTPRGKQRLHQRPNASEIKHCRWWLEAEIAQVKPKLIVAMGASAAQSLTGNGAAILARRGQIKKSRSGLPVLITLHPSHLLRLTDAAAQDRAKAQLQADLVQAVAFTASGPSAQS